MANLSNINDKFLVTTGGNVLIGQTAAVGSSILQVTGASSPLAIHTPSGNNGLEFILDNGLYTNWQIGVQNQVGNALTIVPSTAAGNTTFSTPVATFLSSGKVGIGTPLPTTTLSVKGTSSNGINVIGVGTTATRCYLGLNASNHGYLSVSGSSGQSPSLINSAGGDSYISGGNFGIGTNSPDARLEVSADTGGVDSIVRFQNTNSTAKSTRIQLLDSAGTVGDALIAYDHSNANALLHYLGMGVNNSTTLVINNSDNVGIGTVSPPVKLSINGWSYDPGAAANAGCVGLKQSNASAYGYVVEASANDKWMMMGHNGTNGIIETTYAATGGHSNLEIKTGSSNYLVLQSSGGNVGIGTDSPDVKLDIEGTGGEILRLRDTDGSYTALTLYNDATSTDSRNWGIFSNGYSYGDFNIISSTTNTGDPDAATGTRLTITKDGFVGIGTTGPSRELDIQASSGWAEIALRGSTNGGGSLEFFTNTTKRAEIFADTEDIVFRNTPTNQERMRISNTGIVTIGGGGNNTSSSNNFIPVKINTPYSTTASPQWSLQGWVATTDGADPFAMTSGETTKNVYMGMIGAAYMNQNRFSIIQGGAERLTINLTQTGGGGSPGFVGIGTGLPSSKLHVVGGATNSQHIVRGPYTVGISGTGVGNQPLSFAYNFNGLFNTGYAVEVYAVFNHWSSGTANYTYCYRKGVFMGYGAAGGTEILGPGGGVSDSASVGAWTLATDNGGSTGYAQRILINKSAGSAGWNGTYWVQIVCSVPLDPTDVS